MSDTDDLYAFYCTYLSDNIRFDSGIQPDDEYLKKT